MMEFQVDTDGQADHPDRVREFLRGLKGVSSNGKLPVLVLSKVGLMDNYNLWKRIAAEEGFEVLAPPPGIYVPDISSI